MSTAVLIDIENEIIDRSSIQKLNPEELFARLTSKKWRMQNLYYIVDEYGQTVPFHFNYIQNLIWEEQDWRCVILKYRQGWVSTLKIIDLTDDVLFWPNNRNNYFITHRQDLLDEFFKKARYTYDSMVSCIKAILPRPKTDNSNELYWKETNSTLKIALDVRWKTPTKIHVSEFAWMTSENQSKVYIAMNEFRQASVTIESTANGLWDVFYVLCMNAKDWLWDYKLLFYPFDIEDRNELEPPENWIPNEDELQFYKNYLEKHWKEKWYRKLFWRHKKIETALALWEDWEKKFNQENPITIEHAFVSSGAMVFDVSQEFRIQKHYKEIEGWKLYLPPTDELVFGIDMAEGWVKWDYSTISWRNRKWQVACQFKWKVNEIILAQKMDFILWYEENWRKYQWLLLPENNVGLAFINECKHYSWFQFMLKARSIDNASDDNIQEKYWFRMTTVSKDLIIREYRWALYRKDETWIWITLDTLAEIRTFQYDSNNRPNAISPNHDDLLVADMIAYHWTVHESWVVTYRPPREVEEDMGYLQRLKLRVSRWDYLDK